jgi:hypothetical protein
MHRVVVRYAASRRHAEVGVRTATAAAGADKTADRLTANVARGPDSWWKDVAAACKATERLPTPCNSAAC